MQMRIREELRPEQERAAGLLQSLVSQMEVRGTGICDVLTCRVWVRTSSRDHCVALNSQVFLT